MKKGLKKGIALALILVLAVAILPGCAETGNRTDKDAVQGDAAGRFDWKRYEGSKIEVSFVQHFISDAVISKLEDFTELTGIEVDYSITPEANYFDKVSASLSGGLEGPDVFMSGAYQLWDYSTAGFVQDLTQFLEEDSLMEPEYDQDDFIQTNLEALRWDGIPGDPVGKGSQLGLPLSSESYVLAYNKSALKQAGIKVPGTYEELLAACRALQEWNGPDSYALALRGARDWGTIHPGYMSMYATSGAADYVVKDNRLLAQVDSNEAVEMTEFFVELIKTGGAPSWDKYTWYEAAGDLGAGKAAMMIDADIVCANQNWPGASEEAGSIAFTTIPVPEEGDTGKSNYWTWAVAMNAASQNKEAAWYFIMYFTGREFSKYAAIECKSLNPVRSSVWESEEFAEMMKAQTGYIDTFNKNVSNTTILFTPQPYFFETTTKWAAALQDIVAGKYTSVAEGMRELKETMDTAVQDINLSRY